MISQCERAAKSFIVAVNEAMVILYVQLTTGLKQKLTKNIPRGHSIGRVFTCGKITYVRTWG